MNEILVAIKTLQNGTVDIKPLNKTTSMRDFFKQFSGKTIKIVVEDLEPKCGNSICKSFGWCQGHIVEEKS